MPLPNPLHTLFLPRRYLQSNTEVLQPGRGRGRREWVMARGLCLHQRFSLTKIPASERDAALELKIRQWSPYADTGRYIAWRGDTAQVWIWDDARRQRQASEMGIKKARVLPETVLRPPAQGNSLRLLAGVEGFEGQFWNQGHLLASHWWPEIPDASAWIRFQRACGQRPDSEVPTAESLPLLERPWARSQPGRGIIDLRHERLWLGVGLAGIIFALSWQGVAIWRWHQAEVALQTQIESLSRRIEPLLTAREQAIEDKQTAERLLALTAYPAQLQLMAAVAERLPPNPALRLLEWHYQNDRLSFMVEGPNLDPRFYVTAYQELPEFGNVTAETGRQPNQMIISMQVKPLRERL